MPDTVHTVALDLTDLEARALDEILAKALVDEQVVGLTQFNRAAAFRASGKLLAALGELAQARALATLKARR